MKCKRKNGFINAPIAQLDRAFDYGSKGCGFDSYWARHLYRDVAQLGSALIWDQGVAGSNPVIPTIIWLGSLVG